MEITKELQKIMDHYGWISFDDINWYEFPVHHKLSEDFLEKYIDYIDLDFVDFDNELSEDFIKKHIHDLNLINLIKYQDLSDEFIKKNFIIHYIGDEKSPKYSYKRYREDIEHKGNKDA